MHPIQPLFLNENISSIDNFTYIWMFRRIYHQSSPNPEDIYIVQNISNQLVYRNNPNATRTLISHNPYHSCSILRKDPKPHFFDSLLLQKCIKNILKRFSKVFRIFVCRNGTLTTWFKRNAFSIFIFNKSIFTLTSPVCTF